MDDQKQQIADKLKSANNILVTVSNNPSVDQLAACIGLTVMLNKLDKHATAVFSGQIPSTIEFLKPEETIEKNTDSLRDFIIALDKSKADKLRYKVEDKVVKIFITPYRTSLSENDLNFSQGDFNVDVVLALGVKQQTELDQAITSHGRILHDAAVMCINNTPGGELGSVNWQKTGASSLSELVTELSKSFDKPLLDGQVATALLTGIVAETDRFRNEKTSAATMSASADLMSAGANQQLVAQELDHEIDVNGGKEQPAEQNQEASNPPKNDDGMLEIDHGEAKPPEPSQPEQHDDTPEPLDHEMELPEPEAPDEPEVHDEKPTGDSAKEFQDEQNKRDEVAHESHDDARSMITQPPTMGGMLTANTQADNGDAVAMGLPSEEPKVPLLNRDSHDTPATLDPTENPYAKHDNTPKSSEPEPPKQPELPAAPEPPKFEPYEPPKPPSPPEPPVFQESELPKLTDMPPSPPPMPQQPFRQPSTTYQQPSAPAFDTPVEPAKPEPPKHETLSQLEEEVHSPHVTGEEVQNARDEVLKALNEQPPSNNLPPIEALNAQTVDLGNTPDLPPLPPNPPEQPPFANSPADQPMTMPMPQGINLPPPATVPPTNAPNPNAPPPVPPPMVPPPFKPGQ